MNIVDDMDLTEEEYHVLRNEGTEPPFSGEYINFFEDGSYKCKACGSVLFDSNTKYQTNCGWPSFDGARSEAVTFHIDTSHGMIRTAVNCTKCNGHLGHVFDDPRTATGKWFCINSVALNFEEKDV